MAYLVVGVSSSLSSLSKAPVELWLDGTAPLDRPSKSVVIRCSESYGNTYSPGLILTEVDIGRV